ncbi:Bax inhibitor-1/YccA family protein [Porphyromonas pogonae]|uniref:Bax inhibitor-1/YccA family protein n=1 Tax=Porphyromonas pogonae TaxID=867595 RepID=UPI002E779673|nr:Bax inhibitor-1/YccA family protein [Porphyromonas pogonae]
MNYNDPMVETQKIEYNSSVQTTLFQKVFIWMALALGITGLTSMLVFNSSFGYMLFTNRTLFWGILIAELVLVFGVTAAINRISFAAATGLFILYSVLNGITLSWIFMVYTYSSIATTFFITAGMFGGMALIGYFTKKDLSSWGNILFMALLGLIIASVVNIFMKSTAIYWITTFVGVILFVALTAYDVNKIKNMFREMPVVDDTAKKMALLGALSLYLDFINLFLYMLRIFGRRN